MQQPYYNILVKIGSLLESFKNKNFLKSDHSLKGTVIHTMSSIHAIVV